VFLQKKLVEADDMKKKLLMIAILLLLCSCSVRTFERPVILSTRSNAMEIEHTLGNVSVRRCVLMLYFFSKPVNYKSLYEELFQNVNRLGGDALIDFQVRADGIVGFWPFFIKDCVVATGTAVRVSGGIGFDQPSVWEQPPTENNPTQVEPKTPTSRW
jgi:hypothetical protein